MSKDAATLSTEIAQDGMKKPIPGRLLHRYASPSGDDLLVEIVERSRVQPPILVPAVPEPMIVWIASGAVVMRKKPLGGEWITLEAGKGNFFLTAAPLPITMGWESKGEQPLVFMHVYLGLPFFSRAVRAATGCAPGELILRSVGGGHDPVLGGLLESIYMALRAPAAPLDSFLLGLAQAMSTHVARKYGQAPGSRNPQGPGLPAHRLHRVIKSMHDTFTQPFDLDRYAALAGLSSFHFSRLFKQATGMSPSRYIVWLRVEEARRWLHDTDRPVIDIGMELGYRSPSHFTQVFRQLTGSTPGAYRLDSRTVRYAGAASPDEPR